MKKTTIERDSMRNQEKNQNKKRTYLKIDIEVKNNNVHFFFC